MPIRRPGRPPRSRRRADQRGAALVEFALVLPLLALLVLGTVDLGRAFRLRTRLENAAREGSAYAQWYPNRVRCADHDDVESRVAAEDASSSGYEVEVRSAGSVVTGCAAPGGGIGPGASVTVEVRSGFDVVTPLVGAVVGDRIVVRGRSDVVVQG